MMRREEEAGESARLSPANLNLEDGFSVPVLSGCWQPDKTGEPCIAFLEIIGETAASAWPMATSLSS